MQDAAKPDGAGKGTTACPEAMFKGLLTDPRDPNRPKCIASMNFSAPVGIIYKLWGPK